MWYVQRGTVVEGPYSEAQLQLLARAGQIEPQARVWRPGEARQAATDLPWLAGCLPPKAQLAAASTPRTLYVTWTGVALIGGTAVAALLVIFGLAAVERYQSQRRLAEASQAVAEAQARLAEGDAQRAVYQLKMRRLEQIVSQRTITPTDEAEARRLIGDLNAEYHLNLTFEELIPSVRLPAKRAAYDHDHQLRIEPDRFDGVTRIFTPQVATYHHPHIKWQLQMAIRDDRPPGVIWLTFFTTSSDGWRWLKHQRVQLLADDQPLAVSNVKHDGDVQAKRVSESLSCDLDLPALSRLLRSDTIEARVGDDVLIFTGRDQELMEEFASHIPEGRNARAVRVSRGH